MVTVGSDQVILFSDPSLDSDTNGLLPIVKMEESSNLLGLVHLVREDFHSTDLEHRLEKIDQLFTFHVDSIGRGTDQVSVAFLFSR